MRLNSVFKNTLVSLPQALLPQHTLSSLMRNLTHCENVVWKNFLIKQIIAHYGVNMNEAKNANLDYYKHFNAFFTRELKSDVRPLTTDPGAIASPADGVVSQIGTITDGDIFQAKGKYFTVTELLGGDRQRAEKFYNGAYTTIYLSPKDYHRLHMPLTGTLREMIHIPGRLFSVNTATTQAVPRLFARNERVVALFDTAIGSMALILVGAIFVSSIETVWHGVVTPPTQKNVQSWRYETNAPVYEIGSEMGRFNMGSTIIVLFEKEQMDWASNLHAGSPIQLGAKIGHKIFTH